MLKTLRSLIDSGRLDDAKEMIPSIISFTAFATKKCLTRVRGPTDNCPVCQIDSASCTTMIEQSELLLEALSQAVGAQVTYESLQCVEEDCFLRMDAHTKSGTWDNGTVWETFSEELDADKEIKAFLSGNNIVGRHRRETKNAKPLHVDQVLGFLVTAGAAYLMRSVHGPDVNVVLLIYSRRTSELLGFDTGSLDPREGTLVTSGPLPHPSANYTLPGQRFAKFLGKYDQVLSLAMAEFKRRRVEVDVYADDGLTETRVIEVDSTRAYSELVASYKRGLSDATLERRAEAEGLATALARLRQVEKALGKRAIYSAKSAENDEKRANRERKRTNMAESQPELDESMLELLS
ncbi:hypothetical protein THAOC_07622 [Thalassiosira oceanica]|uniref:Uncharacterized protein n=1 Tax=Thalassiosira oceanica TaxID=159749 RepID=K0TK01_THAOC|nr:hypothetical protein THAOC_07622 [Thalassiosira oceanica]|eukprot:EJK70977.1 hypothetical protein THAOC_07622 [Thalassiosira oceanica]